MRFNRLVNYVAMLSVFAMAVRPAADSDTWWHLRAGAWMVEHGELLRHDPFSLTRLGDPWIYPGWLSQIGLYWINAEWGSAGLNIFTGAMVLLAFAAVWLVMQGNPLLRAFILLLGATASGVYWSARPQIMTFALCGIWISLVERARAGSGKRLYFLPLLMAFWVNIHGGFAVGFILLAIYLLADLFAILQSALIDRKEIGAAWLAERASILRLLSISMGCLIAAMINPHGPMILVYPFKTISIGTLQKYIAEWQSPDFHQPEMIPFAALLFLTFFCLALSKEKRLASDFLLLAVFGYMGLVAVRNVALFALVSMPILARHAHSILLRLPLALRGRNELPQRLTKAINLCLALLFTFLAAIRILSQMGGEVNQKHLRDQFPLGAFEFIREQKPSGPLFNSYNWGAYVLWELYPDYLSFVDGRTDLFGEALLDGYIEAWLAGPGWERLFDQWEIQLVLIETNAPLAQILEKEGWAIRYQDEQASIFTRGANGF